MKNILLINANSEKIPYPVPPLGLCILTGILEKKYNVRIYDGMFEGAKYLIDTINEFKPDYIGISMRNIDNLQLTNPVSFVDEILNNYIKPIKETTDVPIIIGGSGFSIYPDYLIDYFDIDYGIVGEGEESFLELLNALDNGSDPLCIQRVVSKNSNKFNISINQFDMKNLPFSEIDKRIDYTNYTKESAYSIQTKRGCGHKCIYCTYPCIEGANFRVRSPKNIVDEIEEAHNRLGNIIFEFVDSTFNDPAGHAEEICKEIINRKINVNLRTMGINPVNVTRELFDLMLKAGFKEIDCTPDSASPKMIKNLKKNFTYEQLVRSAELIKEYDMPTVWFFIFGGPGENEETLKESFDFMENCISKYDVAHMTLGLRVYPDTDLYDISLKEGIISPDDDLIKPFYYISKELGKEKLDKITKEFSDKNPNCLTATESTPSPDMVRIALKVRERNNIQEPLFRTLLRLRYQMIEKIKLS